MPDLVRLGQLLPELRVLTATDAPTSIKAHLGSQVTLLNFLHGTWCPDCVSQLYRLQRHRPEIAAAGAEIIVVTRDRPEVLAAFLLSARPSLKYTVLVDPDGQAHRRIGAGGHTLALVLDRRRTVRWIIHWSDHHDQSAYQAILCILQEVRRPRLRRRKPEAKWEA